MSQRTVCKDSKEAAVVTTDRKSETRVELTSPCRALCTDSRASLSQKPPPPLAPGRTLSGRLPEPALPERLFLPPSNTCYCLSLSKAFLFLS